MFETIFTLVEGWLYSDISMMSAFAIWFVTFIAGENGGLLSVILAFHGYFGFFEALFFTFLGSLSADVFWYFATTKMIIPLHQKWFKKKLEKSKVSQNKSFLKAVDRHPYLFLVFIKFLVGVRLLLTIYIVIQHRISFRAYLICNVIANTLFVAGIYTLAWFFSESMEYAFQAGEHITGILTTVFVITVGGNILFHLFRYLVFRSLRSQKSTQ